MLITRNEPDEQEQCAVLSRHADVKYVKIKIKTQTQQFTVMFQPSCPLVYFYMTNMSVVEYKTQQQ